MKAIIAEINKNYAIAIFENGDFKKIKPKAFYSVGAVVDLSSVKNFKFHTKTKFVSVAAALIFVFALSISTYAYFRPYNYINIDINPSVEVVTNMFNKTIGIKALNDDGKKILSTIRYSSDNVDECVKLILDLAILHGYLPPVKSNAVMITVSNNDNNSTENLNEKLENLAENELDKINVNAAIYVESATMKTHDNAVNSGRVVGRQIILAELRKVDSSARIQDLEKSPVIKIMEKIKDAQKPDRTPSTDKKNNEKNSKDSSATNNSSTASDKAIANQGTATTNQSTTATDKSKTNDNSVPKDNSGNNKGKKIKSKIQE
ncbi:MAG: anti-sigma factor domain-containing protein [Clostridia bacterium]